MEVHDGGDQRAAESASIGATDIHDKNDTVLPRVSWSGIRSGEIFVALQRRRESNQSAIWGDVAPGIHALALEPRSLRQTMEPVASKITALRQRRQHIQERQKLLRQRFEIAQQAIGNSTERLLEATTDSITAVDRYDITVEALETVYREQMMETMRRTYAQLHREKQLITSWTEKENRALAEQKRVADRRHQRKLFGIHLANETLGHVRMSRLQDDHAQRARCIKAATENIKKGFYESTALGARITVTDVYKIENKHLLREFERWMGDECNNAQSKVKGLFCCVPAESLERCVVYGMFGGDDEMHQWNPCLDQPVFHCSRSPLLSTTHRDAQAGTRRFVAQQAVDRASPIDFPRRFSRYSTLDAMRAWVGEDLAREDAPVRYLALCRVAMGKTQRVSDVSSSTTLFPANPAVGSLFYGSQEEYAVRYPQAVVPEFIIEYQFVKDSAELEGGSACVINPASTTEALPSSSFTESARQILMSLQRQPLHQFVAPPVRFGPSLQPIFDKKRLQQRPHSVLVPRQHQSTEAQLDQVGRQRRRLTDDLSSLRAKFWSFASLTWTELNAAYDRPQHRAFLQCDAPRQNPIDKPVPPVQQSLIAKKLYSDLAKVRHAIDASSVPTIAAVKKLRARQRKDPAAPRPRPFR